ncbi:type III secretion system translocon subunit SctE [unidentified bacterial endosymbiont]|uniref:type III secretion system translocon subunit SctE n=1 Tax=unidentified bacterial endosymbiont TaxID=2355 RepID=UPI00209FE378|nr:type III secretion system translocon subunit SctE [unidentified bacterial endosymbiont]
MSQIKMNIEPVQEADYLNALLAQNSPLQKENMPISAGALACKKPIADLYASLLATGDIGAKTETVCPEAAKFAQLYAPECPQNVAMMVFLIVMKTYGSTAASIQGQIKNASDVQTFLRDKQVKEYQEQINKAIKQGSEQQRGQIINAVFDWIIGAVEAVVGALKLVEGIFTADPLAVADAVAYFSAGVFGMLKAFGETAKLLGADGQALDRMISTCGTAQSVCEGVAVALDIFQIARGISAARAITKSAQEVMHSPEGHALLEKIAQGAESEISQLTEKILDKVASKGGMSGNLTASFTREGMAKMIQKSITEGAKTLQKLEARIHQELWQCIVRTTINDCTNKWLKLTLGTVTAANKISSGVIQLRVAELQKSIDQLVLAQNFINTTEENINAMSRMHMKNLNEAYQNMVDVTKYTSDFINDRGVTLAHSARGLA